MPAMSRGGIHEQANPIRVGFAVAFFVVRATALATRPTLLPASCWPTSGVPNVTAFVVAGLDRI
jgi:hypothetical protein